MKCREYISKCSLLHVLCVRAQVCALLHMAMPTFIERERECETLHRHC